MILVTGAAGKTGLAMLQALSRGQEPVRALVRREDQAGRVRRCGAAEIVVAEMLDPTEMTAAMTGIRAVYLICPNLHPEEARIGEIAFAAGRQAGVDRMVYHSVLHPQTRDMPHHWQKLVVEERLFKSGLEFTILQPSAYMQNVLPYWTEIVDTGLYRVPYGQRAALSLVDLEDVARAAVKVLTEPSHVGATYELAGPKALTPAQIAAVLSRSLGQSVKNQAVAMEIWEKEAGDRGLEGYALSTLAAMFRYYDEFGLIGNSAVLECLMGRPPTTFEEFVDRVSGSK